MVINHVPANAPSHMRQTIGLESAAACTSMYDGSHPWATDGPIFMVVWVGSLVGGLKQVPVTASPPAQRWSITALVRVRDSLQGWQKPWQCGMSQ